MSDFYDNVAYPNNQDYIERQFERNITPSEIHQKDVLDYGCGFGSCSFKFLDYEPRSVIGLDIGEKNLEFVNRKKQELNIENIRFHKADLNHYEIEKEKFDFIWSDTVIMLLDRPVESILKNFHQALKTNGTLYISFPHNSLMNKTTSTISKVLRTVIPQKMRKIVYYSLYVVYYAEKVFKGNKHLDRQRVKAAADYCFAPVIKAMNTREIVRELENHGFEIRYVRSRVRSDFLCLPHKEIKAVKNGIHASRN